MPVDTAQIKKLAKAAYPKRSAAGDNIIPGHVGLIILGTLLGWWCHQLIGAALGMGAGSLLSKVGNDTVDGNPRRETVGLLNNMGRLLSIIGTSFLLGVAYDQKHPQTPDRNITAQQSSLKAPAPK